MPALGAALGAGETSFNKADILCSPEVYILIGGGLDKEVMIKDKIQGGIVSGFGREQSSSFYLDEFFLF